MNRTTVPKTFPFESPPIPSIGLYTFVSDGGVEYEVRFGRKQNDILFVNIVFGVTNEEYAGEEYVLTAKNEFYSVMQTIEAIILDFIENNPNVHGFEFSGEPVDVSESEIAITKRSRIYMRYAKRIFPEKYWATEIQGNKVVIERKRG